MSLQSYTLFLRAFRYQPKNGWCSVSKCSISVTQYDWPSRLFAYRYRRRVRPRHWKFHSIYFAKLATPSQYLGVELNADFTKSLQKQFPYASFSCGRAEEIQSFLSFHGHNSINHLISGLPFASLAAEDTTKIIESVTRACTNGATFTTFQYLHAFKFKNAKQFRARMKETFGPCVRVRVVLFNLFPAVVLTWRKTEKLV